MGYRMRWVGVGLLVLSLSIVAGCSLFNSPPVANFTWSPLEPLARAEVEFESTSTDEGGLFGGGGIVSYDWDFDDGDSASSANPTHEFAQGGDYSVTLTVTDSAGETTSVTKRVEITASIDGTWRGFIVDDNGIANDMELDISQSTSGGLQGSCYMLGAQLACDAMSFNPQTKQVRFNLMELGIRLDGTLDASGTRIQGTWYILGTPINMWSWDVALQD